MSAAESTRSASLDGASTFKHGGDDPAGHVRHGGGGHGKGRGGADDGAGHQDLDSATILKHGGDDGAGHVGHGGHGGDDGAGHVGHGGHGGDDAAGHHGLGEVGVMSHGGGDGGGGGGGGGHGGRIMGTDGADSLTGTSGDDRIQGLGGNDTIDGGTGGDRIDAGAGDDVVTSLHAAETGRSDVRIDLGDGADTLTFSGDADTRLRVSDGAGDDTMVLDGGGRVEVRDGAGADLIEIVNGADDLRVRMGADTDTDTIKIDAGAKLDAGIQLDHFAVGDTGDKLDLSGFLTTALTNWDGVVDPFSDGHLQLVQDGHDVVLQIDADGGGDSWATLAKFHDADATTFTAFNFNGLTPSLGQGGVNGGGGDDHMHGHGGDDGMHGRGGDDTLLGGAGDDTLAGGGGDDVLQGGAGNDLMSGGGGHDIFVFHQDAMDGSTDTITDLENEDSIDLSAVDADIGTAGDQAFAFVASFTGAAGQATLAYDAGANHTTAAFDVDGDGDGDGAADLTLVIHGEVTTGAAWVL